MKTDLPTITDADAALNYLTSNNCHINPEPELGYKVTAGGVSYELSKKEMLVFSAGYRAAREGRKGLPPFPAVATFDEALLAVLRLGYAVELDSDPSGENGVLHRALVNLRELGWQISVQYGPPVLADETRRQIYSLRGEFTPGWVWGLPIPVIKMSGG